MYTNLTAELSKPWGKFLPFLKFLTDWTKNTLDISLEVAITFRMKWVGKRYPRATTLSIGCIQGVLSLHAPFGVDWIHLLGGGTVGERERCLASGESVKCMFKGKLGRPVHRGGTEYKGIRPMRLDCIGVVFLALLSHTMNHQLALVHTLLVISWEQILRHCLLLA